MTLTFPGQDRRDALIAEFGKEAPRVAYEEMSLAFDRLIRALKKRFGDFDHFRIVEPQRDGFPHFHVLLVGAAVIPKRILGAARALWWIKYALGSVHIRAKKPFENLQHAVNYTLKYITKRIRSIGKYKRVFTASRFALERVRRHVWSRIEVFLGCVDLDIEHLQVTEVADIDQAQFGHISRLTFKGPIPGIRPVKIRSDWEQAVASAKKAIAFHDLTERI